MASQPRKIRQLAWDEGPQLGGWIVRYMSSTSTRRFTVTFDRYPMVRFSLTSVVYILYYCKGADVQIPFGRSSSDGRRWEFPRLPRF